MSDHFSSFTKSEALEAIKAYSREHRKLMRASELDKLEQAESTLWWDCANARGDELVSLEQAALVRLVHELDNEER